MHKGNDQGAIAFGASVKYQACQISIMLFLFTEISFEPLYFYIVDIEDVETP